MLKTDFKKLLTDGKAKKLIIICGIIGIGLIFLSGFFDGSKNDNVSFSVSDYKEQTQKALGEMLSEVEGVGDNTVLLTIENSVEGVYLQNSSTKTKEIEPKIRGVVVACEGGDDSVTVETVNEIITKSLNISSAKVCVTKLKELR